MWTHTKERQTMKEDIENQIELLEERLFLVDMIDHWDDEDRELYTTLSKKIKELKEQLNNLPKENHE